jgi:hypothetical protein
VPFSAVCLPKIKFKITEINSKSRFSLGGARKDPGSRSSVGKISVRQMVAARWAPVVLGLFLSLATGASAQCYLMDADSVRYTTNPCFVFGLSAIPLRSAPRAPAHTLTLLAPTVMADLRGVLGYDLQQCRGLHGHHQGVRVPR